jgi:glutamine synthetase
MKTYKAEYIWVDGTTPTAQLRSKTKVLKLGEKPFNWTFDGSSCCQAQGEDSDCVLRPVFICDDPLRNPLVDKLVLCEVLNSDMTPHLSNERFECKIRHNDFHKHEMWFGIEQEYTLFKDGAPLGFRNKGAAAVRPQGPYYCGVGTSNVMGRDFVEDHLNACLAAGLKVGGINAEVMPGQWEFQVGPSSATHVSDQLWVARYLLERISEKYGYEVTLEGKPVPGDWNGAGAHTNFSTKKMRRSYEACENAAEALGERAEWHIKHYGVGIEKRLTGQHETCSHEEYRWGVSDRGASVRIPWHTVHHHKGYIEDRRPNANCDPYVVTKLILETVCSRENSDYNKE